VLKESVYQFVIKNIDELLYFVVIFFSGQWI